MAAAPADGADRAERGLGHLHAGGAAGGRPGAVQRGRDGVLPRRHEQRLGVPARACPSPTRATPSASWVRLYNDDHRAGRASRCRSTTSPAPVVGLNGRVRRGHRNASFTVQGVHPDYEVIEKSEIVEGRFLNPDDQRQRRKVAVIGVKVQQTAVRPGREPAAGETIEISRHPLHRWWACSTRRTRRTRSSRRSTCRSAPPSCC